MLLGDIIDVFLMISFQYNWSVRAVVRILAVNKFPHLSQPWKKVERIDEPPETPGLKINRTNIIIMGKELFANLN